MNIKTITSVDGVNTVDFGSAASRFYWFKNIGTTTVYVSGDPDITAGGDGVAELAAGGSVCIETLGGKVYILGAGKVQIHNTGDKFCPFKSAPVSSGGGVIIPLNVVEPGSYWAKDYGCDGFDPVNVSNMYKKLYEQLTGELPDVTDDNGNIIPDAVTNSDNDAFADYLSHISFGADGGSVTSHGLDGDTEFKFEVYVIKIIYADGSVAYSTSVKLTTRNLVTGQENVKNTNGYSSRAGEPAHRVKITDVSVSSSAVNIKFDFINGSTGDVINYQTVQATVGSVGGTSFRGEKDWGSSVTQNSEPSEIKDYS